MENMKKSWQQRMQERESENQVSNRDLIVCRIVRGNWELTKRRRKTWRSRGNNACRRESPKTRLVTATLLCFCIVLQTDQFGCFGVDQFGYCIQGKFRPSFIFALWPEGEFKTGLIQLFIKDYVKKNWWVGEFKTGRISLRSPYGENKTVRIQSCIQYFGVVFNKKDVMWLKYTIVLIWNMFSLFIDIPVLYIVLV